MKGIPGRRIVVLYLIFVTTQTVAATSISYFNTFSITTYSYMDTTATSKEERKKVAKAILELHDLYISTGEAQKPMTISLPDLSEMADLSEEKMEEILIQLIDEKIIQTEKSAISILKKRKLKRIAGYWVLF